MIRSDMSTLYKRLAVIALSAVTPALLSARQAAQPPASGDMIDRIFKTREFTPRPSPPAQWLDAGASYVVVETDPAGQKTAVRYDSATGAKREVAITAAQLTPRPRHCQAPPGRASWRAIRLRPARSCRAEEPAPGPWHGLFALSEIARLCALLAIAWRASRGAPRS